MIQKLVWLGLAGALGSLARYGLSGVVQRWAGASFPWGTFAVNVLGCFLFGLLWAFCENRLSISPGHRVVILTGFMGAFTTFSTFMFETHGLLEQSGWLVAAGNFLGQGVLGIAFLALGVAGGRML